jgi:hypothetical protein
MWNRGTFYTHLRHVYMQYTGAVKMKNCVKSLMIAILFLSGCVAAPVPTAASIQLPTVEPTLDIAPVAAAPIVQPTQPSNTSTPADDLAEKVVAAVETMLKMPAGSLRLASIEPVQWVNGCLGLPAADEACTEMVVDGYKLYLATPDYLAEVHTDLNGSNIRIAGLIPDKTPEAVRSALRDLALRLQLGANQTPAILSYNHQDWPDACLGVAAEGVMCAQVITPGYEATFVVNGRVYTFHTDETGGQVILSQDGSAETGMRNVLIVLDTTSPDCTTAMFSDEEVSMGQCGGEIKSKPVVNPNLADQINWYADMYAPFELSLDSVRLRFEGRGGQIASAAEQRSILEWAILTSKQVDAGMYSPDAGLVAVIDQTGGIAGICRRVTLNLSGWAAFADCRGKDLHFATYRMTSSEIETMFQLYDRLGESQNTLEPPAGTADGFQYQVSFYGMGADRPASEDLQTIILLMR